VVNTSLPVRRVGCQPGCLDVWQKRHEQTPSRREDSVVRPGPCPHQQDGSLRQSGPPHRKEQGSALADQTWRSRCRCIAKGSASAGTTQRTAASGRASAPPESGRKLNKRFSARKKRGRPRPDEGAPRSLRPSRRPRFPGFASAPRAGIYFPCRFN
jgi:hypothetical protein